MQLHLDTAELDLIADVLLQSEAQVSSPQASEASPNGQKAPDSGIYEELLDNVLARNMEFDSDELEQLADILARQKRAVYDAMVHASDGSAKAQLQHKLQKLERVLEKIDEVCARL